MRVKGILALLLVFSLAEAANAQTKISGTSQCGKPDVHHMIAVGDRPNHSFMISQNKCTWTKPWEIAGISNKEGVSTSSDETTGNRSRTHGIYLDTMANGDKVHYRYQGMVSLEKGVAQSGELKWRAAGGTGKLKGIKAQGTCKGTANPEGGLTWECEGEYQLPQ